jgi:hypothetical protein
VHRTAILLLCLLVGAYASPALAQPAGGQRPQEPQARGRQPGIGPGVQQNIVSVEKVMREIHQLMFQGPFTPPQATEVSEIMIRLGVMLQEMSGPQREQLAPKHEEELNEIRARVDKIRKQLKNQ